MTYKRSYRASILEIRNSLDHETLQQQRTEHSESSFNIILSPRHIRSLRKKKKKKKKKRKRKRKKNANDMSRGSISLALYYFLHFVLTRRQTKKNQRVRTSDQVRSLSAGFAGLLGI